MRIKLHSLSIIALASGLLAGCGRDPAPAAAPQAVVASPAPAPANPAPTAKPLPSNLASIAGTWEVDGVAPQPDGVQAYAEDDPRYLGRRITIAADALSWAKGPAGEASTDERCAGPAIQRDADAAHRSFVAQHRGQIDALGMAADATYEVACLDGGEWGPEGAMIADKDGRIAFVWYDSIILRFRRAGR